MKPVEKNSVSRIFAAWLNPWEGVFCVQATMALEESGKTTELIEC